MPSIEFVNWNPRRRVAKGVAGALLPRQTVNNFGDLLGPVVCREILRRAGIQGPPTRDRRLLSVGSVLSLARDGDVVWGTGVNGKSVDVDPPFSSLDVRAVRGPKTRAHLTAHGIDVPEVYGDPGLLVGRLWSREQLRARQSRRAVTIIPNLNDLSRTPRDSRVVNPRAGLAPRYSRRSRPATSSSAVPCTPSSSPNPWEFRPAWCARPSSRCSSTTTTTRAPAGKAIEQLRLSPRRSSLRRRAGSRLGFRRAPSPRSRSTCGRTRMVSARARMTAAAALV